MDATKEEQLCIKFCAYLRKSAEENLAAMFWEENMGMTGA
jgi:hypothetical protein